MYNNPIYNPQLSVDRINNQIAELEKLKSQIPPNAIPQGQPASINQTFQLAPNNNGTMRYVTSIDEVNKEVVNYDTPFFSKDLTVMWIKNSKGEVKAYEMNEIVQKDEKDLIIESLQLQINQLRNEVLKNATTDNDDVNQPSESEKPAVIPKGRAIKKK